jgi:Xaa-Pro aminopeptidase
MTKPDLLIYGAPDALPDLFHAVPAGIIDPFLYVESNGRRAATVTVLDADKLAPLGIEIIDPYELGADEMFAQGLSRHEIDLEFCRRACERLGVRHAVVPSEFPVGVADHLRAAGIELVVDPDVFVSKRRVKTAAEIEGIRRAQKAADQAMALGAELIRDLRPGLTSEAVRAEMQGVCDALGCDLPDDVIVSHGAQGAVGHEPGHGVIGEGEGVIVDIWPRDRASRCWADMTRTFVAGGGDPPDELARYWQLAREALDTSFAAVRAGADCRQIYGLSCEPFERAGYPTQRSKADGATLDEGYFHSLGHGVGLEVHERPNLGRTPDTLMVGDVITLEPGCYRKGFGGVRLEDLVLVGEDGAELLTDFPYDL